MQFGAYLKREKTFKVLTTSMSKLLFGPRSKNFAVASGDASYAGKQEIRNICAKSELDAGVVYLFRLRRTHDCPVDGVAIFR